MLLYTSDLLPYLFLVIIPIFIAFVLKSSIKTQKHLPPGPWGLPIIGNLLKVGNKPHRSLTRLATIYGPIMSLKLGQTTTIVISSSTIAREALQKQHHAFSDRNVPNAMHTLQNHSVLFLPVSDHWRSLRKKTVLLISVNNKVGHSNPEMLNQLMAYVNKCIAKNEVVDIGRATYNTSLNLLLNTIFSVNLADLSRDLSTEFADLVHNIVMEFGTPNLADFFPLLSKFDLQGIKQRMNASYVKLLKIFRTLIDERLELRRSTKVNREDDGLDILLNSSEGNGEIDITDHLECLFADFFIAGTHTTSTTIEWAMAELLKNPGVFEQARLELRQTIGKGKLIEDSDISSLPYLVAIARETVRKNPSIPFSSRKLETNVEICGYKVPKGAQVLINGWAIGRDPNMWENPELFNPERFLNSNINDRLLDSEFIAFGGGKRICPGMTMAMKVIPIVVGSLVNLFDWKLEGGIAPEELDMDDKYHSPTLHKAKPLRLVPIRF